MTAGESLPAELQRRFSERFGHPVLDGIGSTEALHIFLSNTLEGASGPVRADGRSPGYEAVLLDDAGTEVSGSPHARLPARAGTVGGDRLLAATRGHRRGVPFGRLAAHRRRVHPGRRRVVGIPRPQQRHDQGRRHLGVAGQGGVGCWIAHPDVLEVAVVGGPRRRRVGERWSPSSSPAPATTIDAAELEAHCRSQMAAFKRPRRIVVVDQLPRTATGKVRRYALREQLAAAP